MEGSGNLLGRKRRTLADVLAKGDHTVEDALFVNERFDKGTLSNLTFRHCTFANISFKEATLTGSTFLNCAFLDCYFKQATLDSAFPASRFISCDFARSILGDKIDFQDYTYWQNCYIKYDEMQQHLPARLNIRVRLASNMAQEMEAAGETRDAPRYRLLPINSWQDHCKKIVSLRDNSYRKKYTGQRLDGAYEYFKSKLQGLIWGYGERAWVPVLGFTGLTLVLYPVIYWLMRDGLVVGNRKANFGDAILFSVNNTLQDVGIGSARATSAWVDAVSASQVVVGFLYAGIFVTLLLKAGVRR